MMLWIKDPSTFDHLKLHVSKLLWSSEIRREKPPNTQAAPGALLQVRGHDTYPHGLLCRRMRPALLHKCTGSCHIPEGSACRAEHGASCALMESWHRNVVHPRWPRVDTQRRGGDGMAAPIAESNEWTYSPVTMFPLILLFSLFSWVNILSALLSRFCYHSNGT